MRRTSKRVSTSNDDEGLGSRASSSDHRRDVRFDNETSDHSVSGGKGQGQLPLPMMEDEDDHHDDHDNNGARSSSSDKHAVEPYKRSESRSTLATGSNTSNDSDKSHEDAEVDLEKRCWTAGNTKSFDLTKESTSVHSEAEQSFTNSVACAVVNEGQLLSRRVTLSKCLVLFFISAAATMVAYAVFHLSSQQESITYVTRLDDASDQILSMLRINAARSRDLFQSWSLHLTASIQDDDDTGTRQFPFVTFPNFERQGHDAVTKTGARLVAVCPIVSVNDRIEWERYAMQNQDWIDESRSASVLQEDGTDTTSMSASISEFIFRPLDSPSNATTSLHANQFLPIWQVAPIADHQAMVNYDLFNDASVPKIFDTILETRMPVLSGSVDAESADNSNGPPDAWLAAPIFASMAADAPIASLLVAILPWEEYLLSLLPQNTPPLVVVIQNPCTGPFSYRIDGPKATYLGLGDRHDAGLTGDEVTMELGVVVGSVDGCEYSVHVYPTDEFHDTYQTNRPLVYTFVAVAVFLLAAIAFQLYDLYMKRQNRKILRAANLSNALVSSLFPDNVRSRIIGEQIKKDKAGGMYPSSSKTLMQEEDARNKQHRGTSRSGKPIADLFPNVTVLFADIAGFTAWSSSREPTQVFTLLESIYNSFDRIATKCKVFKVETIGDCYVAAAGLPEARDDHAAVMARFAVLCMKRFREVVLELERNLGPDTAELALRAGLHSGPVTAGVLRGEKSRFQLFGDTVNTASRMESTGEKSRIHISQMTADLVICECDELSVKPREQLIEVKGKGKMQTYWLIFENDSDQLEENEDVKSTEGNSKEFMYTTFQDDALGVPSESQHTTAAALPASEKQKRLIDWNVDVLQGLLKKVVAMRNSDSKKATKKLAKLKIDREEGQMVIDEVKEVINIRSVKSDYRHDPNTIELGSVVTAQLRDYVTVVAQNYRANHFHSFEHASHVTQSVIKLLGRITAPISIDYDSLTYKKKEDAVLHYYTHGITSDPLTQFAAAFSALIHDLDHKGVPNATLIKEKTEEAKRYKNKSVAEQNSVDRAWEILMRPEYVDLRACIYNSKKEFQRFRQLVVNAVMATDIVDGDLKKLRNDRWNIAFNIQPKRDSGANDLASTCSGADLLDLSSSHSSSLDPLKSTAEDMNRKATIVIEHLIQASDVSHTMQHWHVYQKWNQRFFFECYQAYIDGRADTDPADGWYQGELGFFDFYIIPLAKKLKECGVFGVSSDEFLSYAQANRAEWEEKGADLVEQYVAAYKEYVFGTFRKGGGPGTTT